MLKIVQSNRFNKDLKNAIKLDLFLIYSIDDEELELFLLRTGTHSDLF